MRSRVPINARAAQSGVALVMALLVVAIAALLAYGLSSQAMIDLTRANTLARSEESRQLALGMEDWAMAILHQQMLSDDGYDSRLQPWASPPPPMPVQGGIVTGQIDDLNGRFNLNSLLKPGDGGRDPVAMERFIRLLAVLELPPAIAYAVADWIDADSSVEGAGAEDLEYLRADPPYRAANRPMVHPAELRWVQGVSDEIYQRLRDHVCALPINTPTQINLNTATLAVWRSLDPAISAELAERMYNRGRAQYKTPQEAFAELEQAGILLGPEQKPSLGVSSSYFLATAQVRVGDHQTRYYSLLQRTREGERVLQRSRGLYD